MIRHCLAAFTVLAMFQAALPSQVDSDATFSPFWLAPFVSTLLWSGVDSHAIAFSPVAQFTPLLAVGQAASRLLVMNPATEGMAYVDAAAVGPVGAPYPAVLFTSADGGRRLIDVELAQTPAEWEKGLMGRSSLPADSGMLFVFPDGETVGFWMKDTPLPLSIAFIDASGRVLSVQDMQPFTTDTHNAPAPYHYALEVPQGYFSAHGIAVGAMAILTLPS